MGTQPARNPATAGISFLVNTYNQIGTVRECLDGVLAQQLDGRPWELLVVDDGSDDGTQDAVRSVLGDNGDVTSRYVRFRRKGGVACRQHGFDIAAHDLVLMLGGDFILTDPSVVAEMLQHLTDRVPFVSLYGPHGGMGTLYRRDVVQAVGGFDLAFNRFGSGFRDDSDLHYRLQDRELTGRYLPHLHGGYEHKQSSPCGVRETIAYALHRVAVHQLDPLVFKRHGARFAADFGVVGGLAMNPVGDFERATGLWRPGGRLELSSPQGVTLVPGRGLLGQTAAIVGGIAYVIAVHAARIRGSFTYRVVLL